MKGIFALISENKSLSDTQGGVSGYAEGISGRLHKGSSGVIAEGNCAIFFERIL